jgi:hypothetical protein
MTKKEIALYRLGTHDVEGRDLADGKFLRPYTSVPRNRTKYGILCATCIAGASYNINATHVDESYSVIAEQITRARKQVNTTYKTRVHRSPPIRYKALAEYAKRWQQTPEELAAQDAAYMQRKEAYCIRKRQYLDTASSEARRRRRLKLSFPKRWEHLISEKDRIRLMKAHLNVAWRQRTPDVF